MKNKKVLIGIILVTVIGIIIGYLYIPSKFENKAKLQGKNITKIIAIKSGFEDGSPVNKSITIEDKSVINNILDNLNRISCIKSFKDDSNSTTYTIMCITNTGEMKTIVISQEYIWIDGSGFKIVKDNGTFESIENIINSELDK